MKKLKPHQIEVLSNASSDPRSVIEIAKSIGVIPQTVRRWRARFPNGAGSPGAKRPYKKNVDNQTSKLLAKLVRVQLDTNPQYLAKCLGLLDFKTITQAAND